VFRGETYFHKWGRVQGWSTMTPKCIPTLGVALVWESRMFKVLVGKAKKHKIGPLGHHWKGLEA